MRVILHAGFHKTGTTSVQQALRLNRRALSPHLRIVLRPGMVAVCEAARAYSVSRDVLDLALFRYELAQLAETWDAGDRRAVLLASEDLSGHMPGRHRLTSYAAAVKLMRVAAETLRQVRPDAAPEFYFSTRAAGPWLASCHAQHLGAVRMALDAGEYAETYRGSADLDAIIDRIAAAVAPHPVHRCPLERSAAGPLGPLDPLLDLIGLPAGLRSRLRPCPPANTAPPPERAARLLALNRSDLDDRALRAAKKALADGGA